MLSLVAVDVVALHALVRAIAVAHVLVAVLAETVAEADAVVIVALVRLIWQLGIPYKQD